MNFFFKLNAIVYNKNLHPFLLCIFVVLYYYNEVEAMCSIAQPIICVIVLLSLIGLCTKLIKYFDYDISVSSFILTLWTFIFFFTMHLVNLITKLPFFKDLRVIFSFIVLIISGVLIQFFLLKLKKNVNSSVKLTQYLNILFLILIPIELGRTLTFLNVRKPYIKSFEMGEAKGKYNLFILIMDGYARADNLKKYWNYDNKAFLDFLKLKGFFVVEKSKSNYCLSEQTLCSVLSLNYLSSSKNPLYKSVQTFDNPLFSTALKMGYSAYNFGLFPIANVESNYTYDHFTVKNFPHYIALQTSLSGYYSFFIKKSIKNRVQKDINIFDKLPKVFSRKAEKKIVVSHSLITHFPYDKIDSTYFHKIFSLNILSDTLNWLQYKSQRIPEGESSKFCRDCYLNQLKISQGLMAQTLNNTWNDISSNSVVLIMSDHGFRLLDEKIPLSPSNKEGYENFAAIYFPDKNYTTLNDSMTILNSARMCVNKALSTKLSYVKDSSNLK